MTDAKRLRILVVSNLLPPQVVGGAELVSWREIEGLRSHGHTVRGLTAQWGDGKAADPEAEERYSGVTRVPVTPQSRRAGHAFSRRPGNEFASNPPLSQAFETLLADFRPDLVHFHNLNGVSLRLPARARRRGIPLVATLHDAWGICSRSILMKPDGSACAGAESLACIPCLEGARSRRLSWHRKALVSTRNWRVGRELCRFARLVFPSHHHLDAYVRAGFPRQRCRVLPNPAPDPPGRTWTPPPPSEDPALRLLYLGSLEHHKAVGLLLKALARLPEPTVRLVLHGRVKPSQLDRLERALRKLGLRDRVRHGGPLAPARVLEAISAADALVVPSRAAEGSSLTILEAMSVGRPVVAARVGGIPELVRDGENGFLFSRGDVGDLRDNIARLASDRENLNRMGQRARASVEKLGMDTHLEGLEALYLELL
jgi:glycosyltransferase involved in cell wall biosynthesis